jgi:hypothetical protein
MTIAIEGEAHQPGQVVPHHPEHFMAAQIAEPVNIFHEGQEFGILMKHKGHILVHRGLFLLRLDQWNLSSSLASS